MFIRIFKGLVVKTQIIPFQLWDCPVIFKPNHFNFTKAYQRLAKIIILSKVKEGFLDQVQLVLVLIHIKDDMGTKLYLYYLIDYLKSFI